MLTEIRQSEKDKYHMISLIGGTQETKQMIGKKRERQTKKQILSYKEQTDSIREVTRAWENGLNGDGD